MFEIRSANKGVLIPRLTQEQIQAVADPADGLLVFCTTDKKFYTYVGSENVWTDLIYGPDSIIYTPCPGIPEVYYGDKNYTTVQIGNQCWFRENLDIGTMIPGASGQTNHSIIEKYCYNDEVLNCKDYGGIYQWDNMMQWSATPGAQGICPPGWHVPTYGEWEQLVTYLGGWAVAGGKMKETGTAHWISPNTLATNSSGFTALPGGTRYNNGSWNDFGNIGEFWSSTTVGPSSGSNIELYALSGESSGGVAVKSYGFSVRCIKN